MKSFCLNKIEAFDVMFRVFLNSRESSTEFTHRRCYFDTKYTMTPIMAITATTPRTTPMIIQRFVAPPTVTSTSTEMKQQFLYTLNSIRLISVPKITMIKTDPAKAADYNNINNNYKWI